MSAADPFDLSREVKIVRSGIRNIFTYSKPINDIHLFYGREKEVGEIIQAIGTPGEHVLLFGDRGVGKSSLANISSELLLQKLTRKAYSKRCDTATKFIDIFESILRALNISVGTYEKTITKDAGGKASLSASFITAGVEGKNTSSTKHLFKTEDLSPSKIAELIRHEEGLLLIDEIDLVEEKETKKLAETIKLLSDFGSNLKILVVGISSTGSNLLGGHKSLQRCVRQIKIDRMSESELSQIILEGIKRAKLLIDDTLVKKIASVSNGFPHFTHLIALKACENAISNDRYMISEDDYHKALINASENAEITMKDAYLKATRSSNGKPIYKEILFAASDFGNREFKASELRHKLKEKFNVEISQGTLNNHFKKIMAENGDSILHRKAKGVYGFNDPRMAVYIKIVEYSNGDILG